MILFALESFIQCIGVIDTRHSDKTKGRKLNIISTVFFNHLRNPLAGLAVHRKGKKICSHG